MEEFIMSQDYYNQALLNKSRSDRFILTLTLPLELRDINSRDTRSNHKVNFENLQFSVYGSVVPAEIIPQVSLSYSGGPMNISSHAKPVYDPVTVNFTIDNEFKNYWIIHKWLQVLRNDETTIYDGEYTMKDKGLGRYSTDFKLIGLNDFDKPMIEWTYKNAFPISLGELTYNHRDAKELDTSFQFVFSHMEVNLIV